LSKLTAGKQYMPDIPISSAESRGKQLQIIPLGDEMPYDFRRPHRHEYFEFFVFEKEGGTHFIDFTAYPILANTIHVVFPGQIHLLKRTTARGLIVVCTREYIDSLSSVFYWQLFEKSYTSPCMSLGIAPFKVMWTLLLQLETELPARQPLSAEMQQGYMSVFLANYVRMQSSVSLSGHHQQDLHIFRRFSAMLESHLQEKAGVAFFASEMAMTPKSLNNSLRKTTGKTCIDLIQERVLTEAKRLLLYTDKSAKEIAYELNFRDNSYFTRFFQKHTGHTPSSFRHFWEEKYHS